MPEKPKNPTSDQPARSSKLKTNLVALGSAAVFSVYAAGFERTEAAARRFANEGDDRLPPPPGAHTGVIHAPSPVAAGAPAAASTPRESTPSPTASAAKVVSETKATSSVEPPKHERAARQSADTVKSAPTAVATTSAPVASVTPSTPAPTPVAASTPSAPAAPVPASVKSDSANQTAPDTGAVRYKDGTYTGWGTSRHGDIQATVMVKSGRITFAGISECLTQYSCSWISALPPQVIDRQSAEVDYVSGATQSTRAFYYAVLEALAKAK